ncbi:MAG: MarR family transcriptional regulator [Acidobacteriota bacterium]
MKLEQAAIAVLETYPQIYFVCHAKHDRRQNNADGLSRRDSQVLQHLDSEPPVRAGELARHLGIGSPALSAAIDRLEERGFAVRRAYAADRRQTEILLTAAGRTVKNSASVLDVDLVAELLERLTPAEQDRAVEGLALLARAAREISEDPEARWRERS